MINYLEPDFSDVPGKRAAFRKYGRDSSLKGTVEVSIVTPYYNTEAFFVETFVSLQAQSLQNWEWIIVDDGSTDADSLGRLARVASEDSRVRVVRQANAGPGAARNTSFREGTGRYVCLLDSDDMVEPTYLEKCVWFLDSHPEFAFCNSHSVVFGEQEYLWTTGFERGKAHLQANSGPPISVIRRTAYQDCGGFDETIRFGHEDWDFWLGMAKAGHWGYTIPEFLQWYRKRGNGRFEQIMRSGDVNADFEALMHLKYKGLDEHFPEPTRHHPSPFETIASEAKINNPLVENKAGRRIMVLVPWMVTGGADRVNLDLIEGLTANGHEITVCATLLANHNWEHQFTQITPDVFVLPHFLHQADFPRFLAYLIKSRKVDTVMITGSTMGYLLLPYLRSASPGVAFIDMCHVEEPHWLNGGHPRFGIGYQEALDLNIVTTRSLANWMEGHGADRSRIRVMYTGIDAPSMERHREDRQRVRAELGVPEDITLIVFIGRICEQKRPALMAEIFRAARDEGLVFRALVLGDGELKADFEALLIKYKLAGQVTMVGRVPHQRWLEVLEAADIFLMPSQYEGISVALLEAMAAGVVPIVARVGGQEEIVGPGAGFLIPHGDGELQSYQDALKSLILNPPLSRDMSEACKTFSKATFSRAGTVRNLEAIMDEAHEMRVTQPRPPVGAGLGLELATLALEYNRLGAAVDWLWNARDTPSSSDTRPVPVPVQGLIRIWTALGSTRLGAALLNSTRLRDLAKWVVTKLEARRSVTTGQR